MTVFISRRSEALKTTVKEAASSSSAVIDGGGFFLAREVYGRMFDRSFPDCVFFFFNFFLWRLARAH